LFSLAVWGSLWGFTGVLLSIPMTITLMLILTQFNATRPIAIMMSESGGIAALKHGIEDARADPA
ncbi:MAG: AI-2E family transporter, partial [Pseudomonadota bacterium]